MEKRALNVDPTALIGGETISVKTVENARPLDARQTSPHYPHFPALYSS